MEQTITLDAVKRLMKCFPGSHINWHGDFIATPHEWRNGDAFFNLFNCADETETKYKVLERLSRSACKSEPYSMKKYNDRHHDFIADGVNNYLGTSFTFDDFRIIYCRLGNCADRELTRRFIESGYDMELLMERKDG